MSITIDDYLRVDLRADELGCRQPQRICLLPENFESASNRQELLVRAEAATLKKLLRANHVQLDELMPSGERLRSIHNKNFDWGALLFVSASLLSTNPTAVSLALGIISNYLTDFFKGAPSHNVRLAIVVERRADKVCKKITYEGDVRGLTTLEDAIRRMADE